MTTIIKTPKEPLRIHRSDPLQTILDALAKLVEKREHVGDVTSQIGFDWTPDGRTPFEGSRMNGHPGRHYADIRTAIDEHKSADFRLRAAIDAYLDQVAPTQLRRPLVVSPPRPAVAAATTVVTGPAVPGTGLVTSQTARRAWAPVEKQSAGGGLTGLWSRNMCSWLHQLTRPLPPGADPVKLGGWMSRRFYLKDVEVGWTSGDGLYVCATNGYAIACLPVHPTAPELWLPQPGSHEIPVKLASDVTKGIVKMLTMSLSDPWLTVSAAKIRIWAPSSLRRRDSNPNEDIEPGVILGLKVNRRLVAMAVAGLPAALNMTIRVDKETRLLRMMGPSGEIICLMGLGDQYAEGPVLGA